MKFLMLLWVIMLSIPAAAQKMYYYSVQENDAAGKEKYHLFTKNGERITQTGHDWINHNYWNWLFYWDNRLISVYDSTGKYMGIDSIQEIHQVYGNSYMIPLKRNGLWGYYTRAGKLQIAHQFDDVTLFRNGKAAVQKNGQTFFIDSFGNRLQQPYKETDDFQFKKLSTAVGLTGFENWPQQLVTCGSKFGLKERTTGKMLLDCIYDGIFSISKDNVVVKAGEKYGVMSFTGQTVIPVQYDMIYLLN